MTATLGARDRLLRAFDALAMAKLLVALVICGLWRGSPHSALGAAFAAPIFFAAIVRVYHGLCAALTGHECRRPAERLGRSVLT